MIIEILYPRLCCLYGDKGNTLFLQKCFPNAEFVFTELNDKPYFLDNQVDLCCMYSMSEQNQERALDRLLPLKADITDALDDGNTQFLFLGNSMELLGKYIETEDGRKIEGLGYFDIHSIRHAPKRFNTLIQAEFQALTLLGYTSRFSDTYGITDNMAFCKTNIGYGSNPETDLEGVYTRNIIATYMLGPILPSNPDFAKFIYKQLGCEDLSLPYEDALYTAYDTKRKEFQLPDLELE